MNGQTPLLNIWRVGRKGLSHLNNVGVIEFISLGAGEKIVKLEEFGEKEVE